MLRKILLVLAVIFASSCGRTNSFKSTAAPERTVEVGLLMRKQFTDDLAKKRSYRHVHAILADGTVVGFNTAAYQNKFWQNVLFKSRGEVQFTPDLKRIRRHYIDADYAQNCTHKNLHGQKMVTDWVKFKVTPTQAAALKTEWEKLAANPPAFRLSGMNCATRAQECMVRAGILPPCGIPGIDRPENMLKTLAPNYPDYTIVSGYFGLDENDQPYMIKIQE